jgi:hypothetical protein
MNFAISSFVIFGFAPSLLATKAPKAQAKSIAFWGFSIVNNLLNKPARKESPAPTVSSTLI